MKPGRIMERICIVTAISFFCNFLTHTMLTEKLSFDTIREKADPSLNCNLLDAVWQDAIYFPVPASSSHEAYEVTYENSWMAERTVGGTRGHEGCDLMPQREERGYTPVVSISHGTIENIGWLKLGGYRIGIRSPHGVYFYYAHLSDYASNFQVGDSITAGMLLGFMGDTGYSEIEGTVGQFPVHLHLGVYLTIHQKETSINPYWMLKELQDNKIKVSE
ncbi:MAG: M23 family metallopeptidase [Lachnospiraceae bacterium]